MKKATKNNAKVVIITIVSILVISGIIIGLVAWSNDGKITDEIRLPSRTSATAVLNNQATLKNVYINPVLPQDKTVLNANIEAVNGKATYFVPKKDVKKTYSADELNSANLTKCATDLTAMSEMYSVTINGTADTTYQIVIKHYIKGVEEASIVANYDIKTGKPAYTQQYKDVKNRINFNTKNGEIDFKGSYVMLIQSDLVDELINVNAISIKPYPATIDANKPADSVPTEPVAPKLEPSATAILDQRMVTDKLYLNQNMAEMKTNLFATDIAMQESKLLMAIVPDNCVNDFITSFANNNFPDIYSTLEQVIIIGLEKRNIIAISAVKASSDMNYFEYNFIESPTGDSVSFNQSSHFGDVFLFDNSDFSINIPTGYTVVINENFNNEIKGLNFISTHPFPAPAPAVA